MSSSKPEPEYPEPDDPEERAEIAVEEAGGLPENNQFAELVKELRDEGRTWGNICRAINQVLDVVDEAAMEEDTTLVAEWAITAKVPEPNTPSGYRYKTYERTAATAAEAESVVEEQTGYEVVEEKTEQVGYGKYS